MARTITISMAEDLQVKVTEAAWKDRRSKSAWVKLACQEKLEREGQTP